MIIFRKIASIGAVVIFIFLCGNACALDASRYVLDNGLTALIKESRGSGLVAIEAQIKTGSATEDGYLGSGISHLVEHMLFKGTRKRPAAGSIEKEIKALGGYTNGFTTYDSTGIEIIVPSEHLTEALDITKDVLTESLFDPGEFEKEREVVLKEVRLNRDDPGRRLAQLLWSTVFKTHNYKFPVIGYEDLIKKLKAEDLVNYYRTRYIPDNIILGIAGDIDTAAALGEVKATFGTMERKSPPSEYSKPEPNQICQSSAQEKMPTSLAYLSLGFHSVRARSNDLFALDVLSIILGNGEDSRLFKSLYRQKQLVYSVGSFNYTPKDPGIFAVNAVLKEENMQKALNEIWAQIDALKSRPIGNRELEKAKNNVISDYVFSRQTVQDQSADMVSGEVTTGDYDFSKKYVEGIKAVNAKSVMEAAKKYLKKQSSVLVTVVPEKGREQKGLREKPAAVRYTIEKLRLKNNLDVLIVEDHSLPIVSLTAVGLGGLRTENFKNNGISNLVARTITCGTKRSREEAIFAGIESAGATLGSFSSNNTFGLAASGLSKDFDIMSETLADVLENPSFEQDKISREKAEIEGSIESVQDDIYQSGMRTLKYVLFKRHPYRFQLAGRLSTVEAQSQAAILEYYNKFYNPDGMILAVAGDIDKNAVKKKIAKLFEKFPERPRASILPPSENRIRKPRVLHRSTDKEQSLLLLGYRGTTINGHDKYVLELLSSVLSGINGRLSQKIREEKGLAYALDMRSSPGIEPGMIIFYVGTTKDNLETVRKEIFSEIERLKKEGIETGELEAAKNELIGENKIALQAIGSIAGAAASGELYGLGFDNFMKYGDRIKHITKECVMRAAKKYLTPDGYVLLLIKGAK